MEIRVEQVQPRHVYAMSSGPTPIPLDQVHEMTYRLFDLVAERLTTIGVRPSETRIAWSERMAGEFGEGTQRVWAGYLAPDDARGEISPVVLDGADKAAVAIHRGPVANILESWNELFDWVHGHGGRSAGYAREVYVRARPLPEEEWVTRLELPFE